MLTKGLLLREEEVADVQERFVARIVEPHEDEQIICEQANDEVRGRWPGLTIFVKRKQLIDTIEKDFVFHEDGQRPSIGDVVFEEVHDLRDGRSKVESCAARSHVPSYRNHHNKLVQM